MTLSLNNVIPLYDEAKVLMSLPYPPGLNGPSKVSTVLVLPSLIPTILPSGITSKSLRPQANLANCAFKAQLSVER